MFVAVASVTLHIPESRSLKARRRVVKSLIERARVRFAVSIAETGGQDTWQSATIGIACVSGSAEMAEEVVNQVLAFVDSSSTEFEIVERYVETLSGFDSD
jgi:uncharacterized protein YlxP (DUF503 family)